LWYIRDSCETRANPRFFVLSIGTDIIFYVQQAMEYRGETPLASENITIGNKNSL
jgi:hypothetical protein